MSLTADPISPPSSGVSSTTPIPGRTSRQIAKEKYLQVKETFKPIAGTVLGASALGIIFGWFKFGATFPAKALKVVGEGIGSIAAIASPFFLIGNEVLNYNARKNGNGEKKKIREVFDAARDGFYRMCSTGFVPFIIEPFINPNKFGKTVFHKTATILNIPTLIFSSVMWAGGNFQALLSWILRTKEQFAANNADKTGDKATFEECNDRVEGYNQLYQSFKRMAVIGSIANPTMQGLRQCADSLSLITGQMSAGEFFKRPFLGLSRIVSLGVALPEYFAKSVDSFVRLAKERENLKAGLPQIFHKPLDNFGKWFEGGVSVSTNEKSTFREIRHYAEIIFHTLSPLSMFSLFAPLLDEPHLHEEAQEKGGAAAFLDKLIGRTGKVFLTVFNGLYVTLGRLPQSIFQMAYFGKKLAAKLKGKEVSIEELEQLKERMCNSSFVKSLSDFAERRIKYLVPDFYDVEHDNGYLTYEQIQTNYAFEQIKDTEDYNELIALIKQFKGSNEAEKSQIGFAINEKINKLINEICIPFVRRDCLQGKHDLTSEEENNIKNKLVNKIKQKSGLIDEPERKELPFVGAEFFTTYFFKLFDLRSRLKAIDYRSSHHNMTTAYDNDEIRISFEYELLPVIGKCIYGLNNTVNRFMGVSVDSEDYEPQFDTSA